MDKRKESAGGFGVSQRSRRMMEDIVGEKWRRIGSGGDGGG